MNSDKQELRKDMMELLNEQKSVLKGIFDGLMKIANDDNVKPETKIKIFDLVDDVTEKVRK